jgi:hypothetical protein
VEKCSQHGKRCSQHGKSVRNTMFGCWLQHARHKLATCSPQTRNIGRNMYTMSGGREGGTTLKKCSQHGKRCSQHSQHALQHHDPTADMFHDSNRVTRKVSDASARIRRPGVSSSVIINIRRGMNIVHSTRVASWSLVEMIIIPLSIYIYTTN